MHLRSAHPALNAQGALIRQQAPEGVLAYRRTSGPDEVFVALNLSIEAKSFKLGDELSGGYRELFTSETLTPKEGYRLELKPWDYKVFVRHRNSE